MEAVREAPVLEIPQVVLDYRQAAKKVGALPGNFGAFRPWYVAEALGDSSSHAFEIFMDPPKDALFADTGEFLQKLKDNPDLDFAIWTQGEMNIDALPEQNGRGFQEIKIEVSDIEKQYNIRWNERLNEIGLSVRTGSLDKTSPEFFEKILDAFKRGGYDKIILLDDKEEKLKNALEQLKDLRSDQVQLIHVNRKKVGELEDGEVRSLSQVKVPLTGRVLVLCDYDGTLSDTEKIKADHEKRLTLLG